MVEWANAHASSEDFYYAVPNSTYENTCYDLIADSNEVPVLTAAYEDCGITGHAAMAYPVKSGVTRMDQIFREFVKQFWKFGV